jgi:hypothetical protein
MRSIILILQPLVRFLVPLAAAGLVITGVAGGERTASAQEEIVSIAPPAPRVELVSSRPSPHHFWAPGYWGYRHGYGHEWNPGVWQPYRPGYSWSQPGWSRGGGGYVFNRGGWSHGGGGGWSHGGGGGYHGGGGFHGGGGHR